MRVRSAYAATGKYRGRRAGMDPFVLNFAPTGMVAQRDEAPHLPVHPEEIAAQVQEAVDLGITMVHLHARNASGSPTHDAGIYEDIIRRIRAFAPDLVVCVSLSGRVRPDPDSRSAPLALAGAAKPDMGSLTLSSLNFSRQASLNAPDTVQNLAREMRQRGIVPELAAFDGGMINYARYLEGKDLLRAPFYFNLILGSVAGAQADPLSLGAMVAQLPQPCEWAAGGIGNSQTRAAAMGLAAGGGVRVGLEDNLFLDRDCRHPATNIDLLKRVHVLAEQLERTVMDPAAFRDRMKMLPGHGEYGRQKTA